MSREKVLNHVAFFGTDQLTQQCHRAGSHWGCRILDRRTGRDPPYHSLEDMMLNMGDFTV